MYKVMITGHALQDLNVDIIPEIKLKLLERIKYLYEIHPDLELVTGMMLGIDTWFADIGIELGIPVHVVIPYCGHCVSWEDIDHDHYRKILDKSKSVNIASELSGKKMIEEYVSTIVNQSHECIAVYDGSTSVSMYVVACVKDKNLPIYQINTHKLEKELYTVKIMIKTVKEFIKCSIIFCIVSILSCSLNPFGIPKMINNKVDDMLNKRSFTLRN